MKVMIFSSLSLSNSLVKTAIAFQKNNTQVAVVTDSLVCCQQLTEKNIKCYKMDFANLFVALTSEKPDIVHIYNTHIPLMIKLLKPLLNFKLVVTIENKAEADLLLKGRKSKPEQLVVFDIELKDYILSSFHYPKEDILVSAEGVDCGSLESIIDGDDIFEELALDENCYHILCDVNASSGSGNIAEKLIALATVLISSIGNLQMIIYGDVSLVNRLKEVADEINQSFNRHVVVLTYDENNLDKFIAISSIVIGEAFTLLKAMMLRKNSIIASNSGYSGIITEENYHTSLTNFFAPSTQDENSEDALLTDILKLYHLMPIENLKTLEFCYHKTMNIYSLEKIVSDLTALYQKAMAKERAHILLYKGENWDIDVVRFVIEDLKTEKEDLSVILLSDEEKRIEDFYCPVVSKLNLFKIMCSMKKVGLFIIGGVDFKEDASIFYKLFLMWIAKKIFRLKVVIYSSAFSEFNGKFYKFLLSLIVDMADVILLRETSSKTRLERLKIFSPKTLVTCDPIVPMEGKSTKYSRNLIKDLYLGNQKILCISLKEQKNLEHFEKEIVYSLKRLLKEMDLHILFLPLSIKDDLGFSKRICADICSDGFVVTKRMTSLECIELISLCDCFLTVSLKGVLYTINAKTPCVGIAYDQSVELMMKHIDQQDKCLNVFNFTRDGIYSKIKRCIENGDIIKNEYGLKYEALKKTHLINKDEILKLLEW